MLDHTGLMPLTKWEVETLSIYNSERARGVVHTPYWRGKMSALQGRFNTVGFERPKKRRWYDFLKGRKNA